VLVFYTKESIWWDMHHCQSESLVSMCCYFRVSHWVESMIGYAEAVDCVMYARYVNHISIFFRLASAMKFWITVNEIVLQRSVCSIVIKNRTVSLMQTCIIIEQDKWMTTGPDVTFYFGSLGYYCVSFSFISARGSSVVVTIDFESLYTLVDGVSFTSSSAFNAET
jgi:hypothetical protein